MGDADGDGFYEEIYTYGGRSFQFWTAIPEKLFMIAVMILLLEQRFQVFLINNHRNFNLLKWKSCEC